jgi:proteasome lid subunit RPN8/RPN11
MKIILKQSLIEQVKAHGQKTYPLECCGFIFGEDHVNGRTVTEVKPATNSKQGDQRRRFEIDPLEYLKAERYALANDITLVGVYHSHPDHPAKPSEHDLKQAVPFFSYLILSVSKNAVENITSWQLDHKGQFEEEIIETTNQFETHN